MENQLINKTYYHTYTEGILNVEPIKILGELFKGEQQNEMPDLSYIRFAQGEVYYFFQDFESAIFKWENVSNELKPWAQKNIADAHVKMNLLAIAEDYYNAIETDSEVLKTEVLMQLFSLYIQLGKYGKAVSSIKRAVEINPDYPQVTAMAREFFEEQQDWENAIELAANEAKRTESLSWFLVLEKYVEQGHTSTIHPNYFSEVLMILYNIDLNRFEDLTTALWNSYMQNDLYFSWLEEINSFLLSVEPEQSYAWNKLFSQYNVAYFELLDGNYLVEEFSYLIPTHLTNWLKISTASNAVLAASAVLTWNEIFPSHMEASTVAEAENRLSKSARYQNGMEDGVSLFKSIIGWAEKEGLLWDKRYHWMIDELQDLNHHHLMITGTEATGKAAFVNTLLEEELSEDTSNAIVLYKDADNAKIKAITQEEEKSIAEHNDFKEAAQDSETIVSCRMPVTFLNNHNLALIDSPAITVQNEFRSQENQYLKLADSLLFVINADFNLTGNELDKALKMKEQSPELPIHFLLCSKTDQQSAIKRTNKIITRINSYFTNAKVFTFIINEDSKKQIDALSAFIKSIKNGQKLEEHRTTNILYYIRKSMDFLLYKREEEEISLRDRIEWNEEIVAKLNGAQNQLFDIEENAAQVIKNSYSSIIEKWRRDLKTKLPILIQQSAEIVQQDSDIRKIHSELNSEINKRINHYIEETVLPDIYVDLLKWVEDSEMELKESETYFREMCESFNQLYGEEKISFECDSRVLNDWNRDIERMTIRNIQLTEATFISYHASSQFLWKGAGKLVDTLLKNKDLLHDKFKQYIKGKDYSKTIKMITDEFMQQFEIFDKSIKRDVHMFFADPNRVIKEILAETHDDIERNNASLNDMQKQPDLYRNPITLFEIKLRQLDWMATSNQRIYEKN
ncbi:GTP-binding protein [Gracilibacillus kekensis]|uniref:Tetratricopeptide repeat-containing protein n=1 Tax=Gracilibacillus kekensis TaxID=1027249 RepID=A0A1M7Q9U8_9BACI|nr:GTP-binding protein [Gracilibacillus kekensis]SHN27399.1 Tetratricopeptide repeat-containing protein [Gracilibacillus kekensis]